MPDTDKVVAQMGRRDVQALSQKAAEIGPEMPQRTRVTVIRLKDDGYLTADGMSTNDVARALKFTDRDARQFLYFDTPLPKYSYMWGASLEMLPKRTRHQPLTREQYQQLLLTMQRRRMDQQIREYQAQADGAAKMATYYQQRADEYRRKMAELQAAYESREPDLKQRGAASQPR
jgi:hypothetical protein